MPPKPSTSPDLKRDMTFSLVVAWPAPTRDPVHTPPTTHQWALQPGRCPAHYYFPGVKRMAFCRGKTSLGSRPGPKNQSRSGFRAEGVQTRFQQKQQLNQAWPVLWSPCWGPYHYPKMNVLRWGVKQGPNLENEPQTQKPLNPKP